MLIACKDNCFQIKASPFLEADDQILWAFNPLRGDSLLKECFRGEFIGLAFASFKDKGNGLFRSIVVIAEIPMNILPVESTSLDSNLFGTITAKFNMIELYLNLVSDGTDIILRGFRHLYP